MQRRELLRRIAVGLGAMSLGTLAANAKKSERLEVQVSANNGMLFDPGNQRTGIVDQAIRVIVNVTNTKAGKVEITKVQGIFFAPDGRVLQKTPPQSLTLTSRDAKSIVFYYGNSEGLYGFKFEGQLEYLVDGVSAVVPILLDETQGTRPLDNY